MKINQGENKMRKIMKENKKISQMRLYKSTISKFIYFIICLLLLGLSCSEKEITDSHRERYQVKFYQDETLLKTISVAGFTVIPTSDYPANTNAEKRYEWYLDKDLTQRYNEHSLVIRDFNLYAQGVRSFQSIIENEVIPDDLADYDNMSKEIFSRYTAGAVVIPRYITANGDGDGSSWANATNDIQAVVNGIADADNSKVYVVLVASGTYNPSSSYVMKNHVALIGGFMADSYDRIGKTSLDGDGSKRLFYNDNNGLDDTALLYGMSIVNGHTSEYGGGMYNSNSSPTLIDVTFSDNKSEEWGGGMYNRNSSPTLINVTFSGNRAEKGGGILNYNSSPTLNNVTFSDNEAIDQGGGMYSYNFRISPPTLINVTFSGNRAEIGGGMYNLGFSPALVNATFLNNTANQRGGGMFNTGSSPILVNMILWNNNNGNIFIMNNTRVTLNLYHSLIEGGTNISTNAIGIRLFMTNAIVTNSKVVIAGDPELGLLANYGGKVNTIPISDSSPAKDQGVYVKGVKAGSIYPAGNLYYSTDNSTWYDDPGLTNPVANLPSDADDLTATDARGYGRAGRPDMGAYEELGTQ